MLAGIDGIEWWVIAVVGLILFGGKKLPEFARAMGKSVLEFRKGMAGEDGEATPGVLPNAKPAVPPPAPDSNKK